MVVWVQFPALPIHFYHKEVLFSLGNMIGRAIKLDYHTLHQERAKFGCIAVEVDLSKPLVPRIWLDGAWQYLEYENLAVVCFECGKVGYISSTCPSLQTYEQNNLEKGLATVPTDTPAPEKSDDEKTGFGPWMQVSRKSRRGNKIGEKRQVGNNTGNNLRKEEINGLHKQGKGEGLQKEMTSKQGNTQRQRT
ncbi:unnamed protein product [Linum trigynum]|uniref:CCHC-type domain-containing protein n=1 Tax=Linum trigynum TaxID=586398 RepID=A0AAV2GSK7_9ROSI